MGLFDKKFCTECGKKKGLLGIKLADGNYLCADCNLKTNVTYRNSKIDMRRTAIDKTMDIDTYRSAVAYRKVNLEKLEQFEATVSLCGVVQIDEDAQQIVFVDNSTYNNREWLYQQNPPVYNFSDLAFTRITYSSVESSTTLMGNAKAECTVYLVAGFEDPLYDVIRVEIGKITVKEGFFSDKTIVSPDIEKLTAVISSMMDWEIAWSAENDVTTPAASMDAYWRLAKRAKDEFFITDEEVKECLHNYYGKDRKLIKEIRKTYGL